MRLDGRLKYYHAEVHLGKLIVMKTTEPMFLNLTIRFGLQVQWQNTEANY